MVSAATPTPKDVYRLDPITGSLSSHALLDRPFPVPSVRSFPVITGPCPFCDPALVADQSEVFVHPNRWLPLGPGTTSELVLTRDHHLVVEELDVETAILFFNTMFARAGHHESQHPFTLCFVNVGFTAGGSQPHLHGQVNSFERTARDPRFRVPAEDVWADLRSARDAGLVLTDTTGTHVYVPYAPSGSGEVRVIAASVPTLVVELLAVLHALDKLFGKLDYNIVLHRSEGDYIAQVLPRVNVRSLFENVAGVLVVIVPVVPYVSRLRSMLCCDTAGGFTSSDW